MSTDSTACLFSVGDPVVSRDRPGVIARVEAVIPAEQSRAYGGSDRLGPWYLVRYPDGGAVHLSEEFISHA